MVFGKLSGRGGDKRAGSLALPLAANSISRAILRHAIETPVSAGPGQRYEVSPASWDGLQVSSIAQRWLQAAPGGPLALQEDDEEEGPVKALVDGWNAGIVHALARRPLTIEELEGRVALRRGVLRSRLTAMREAGLLEPSAGGIDGVRYEVTPWLREAVAPLAAAIRTELRHPPPEAVPVDALDAEALLLLALPLPELPADLAGTCRMTVQLGGMSSEVSVTAGVESGRVVALAPGEEPEEADARAAARVEEWLDTLIEPDAYRVSTGGEERIARILLDALHERLYGV